MPSPTTPVEISRDLTHRILKELVGSSPLQRLKIRLWDGSYWPENASDSCGTTLVLNHPGALREMLLANSESALGEAYLQNDFDVEGDMEAAFELADIIRAQTHGWSQKLKMAHLLWQLPPRPADREPVSLRQAALDEKQHSVSRDQAAVQFHYDLSNDFYSLWLDSRKVYSCAYFQNATDDLDSAQLHKLDTICRKLGLRPGQRLMDIGCGWGGLILHVAAHYGVRATGITLSERQAEYAHQRISALGLQERVEVRLQDYRALEGHEDYDAVVSVGMVEHVGRTNLPLYFGAVNRLLKPGGLFLNHGICTGAVPALPHEASFIDKYVFPDSDLFPISEMLAPAEVAGFEIRDVENLREHYALTLRHWVRRLERHHGEALKFVSEPVYRTWRAYMAGSAHRFNFGFLAVYQTLLAKLSASGEANVPLSRAEWYGTSRIESRTSA
ncbi:MAG: cyclopropane-fatty-acyl-phospholipid synthase family protein [Verrucomicrobiota bacterium]